MTKERKKYLEDLVNRLFNGENVSMDDEVKSLDEAEVVFLRMEFLEVTQAAGM